MVRIKVSVRLMGINASPVPQSYDLELDAGATVEQALQAVVDMEEGTLTLERLVGSILIVANSRVYAGHVLEENDKLTVLRTLEGG